MEYPLMVGDVVVNSRSELLKLGETNLDAQIMLIDAFYLGEGMPRDYKKAVYYAEKAVEHKHTQSMINLSFFYRKAIGCKRDVLSAEKLLLEAEKLKDDEAYAWLAEMYLYGMGPVKQDTEKAFDYVYKALNSSFDSEFLLEDLNCSRDEFMMLYKKMKAGEIPKEILNQITMRLRSDSLDEYNEE